MTFPVDRSRSPAPLSTALEGPAAAVDAPRTDFRDALARSAPDAPDLRDRLAAAAMRIARGEEAIDRVVERCRRGGAPLSSEQLIAIQTTVYRHAQEVELAAKLVDKLTGAVRQTLTSQQ